MTRATALIASIVSILALVCTGTTFAGEPQKIPFHFEETSGDAAGSPRGDRYVSVLAGTADYSEKEGMYRVGGGAVVSFGKFTLRTENLEIDLEKETAYTESDFVMETGGLLLKGESFSYGFASDTGMMKDVTTNVQGLNFHAQKVNIEPGGRLSMAGVIASTCCLEDMEYHVSAERVDLLADGRARFKKLSFYFKGRRLFKWPSYTTDMGLMSGPGSGVDVGGWIFSPPSLGYSDYGGVNVGADLKHTGKLLGTPGIFLNYYSNDGLFSEARYYGSIAEEFDYSLRFGKQYKQNTGYFRYFDPVIVWNEPTFIMKKRESTLGDTGITFGGSFELGRMREADSSKTLDRFFFKGHVRMPLTPRNRLVRFSLLGDGRYGVYKIYREYRIWGSGFEFSLGRRGRDVFRLQYMEFRHAGRTPFKSDLVNTNDKLFGYTSIKLPGRHRLTVDAQYDMDVEVFDEIEYALVRNYQCLSFHFSWRTEAQTIGMSLEVLNQQRGAR